VCDTRRETITLLAQRARELGATAIIALALAHESVRLPRGGVLLLVSASGTAVTLEH
jgi:uncharacterized protein YbjQ (UPF0145 family)